jgi:hypothetical protein
MPEISTNLAARTSKRGWFVGDDDGYIWYLQGDGGELIGKCSYSYIKVMGVEEWHAVFYQQSHDIESFGPYIEATTEGLYECANWVEQYALGGYYL